MKTFTESIVKNHISLKDYLKKDIDKITDYLNSRFWNFPHPNSEYYKTHYGIEYIINKDSEGYYIDTKGKFEYQQSGDLDLTGFNKFFTTEIDRYNKIDKKDCPYFRWRNHDGNISLGSDCQKFCDIDGLPDKINTLFFGEDTGIQSKTGINLGNHEIKLLKMYNCGKIKLTGNPKVDEIEYSGWNGKKPTITFNCKNIHS